MNRSIVKTLSKIALGLVFAVALATTGCGNKGCNSGCKKNCQPGCDKPCCKKVSDPCPGGCAKGCCKKT